MVQPRHCSRLLGEQHRQRIDFLAGRAARRPDAQPLRLRAALGQLGQRMALEQVERRAVAEEIGLVVEQRLDHLLRQAWLLAHDEDGDQLVERGDAALAQQRRQARSRSASGGSSSVAGRSGPRAGRRGSGWSCRLLARGCSSVREAIRRAILSGGSTAQARPASSTARGIPQTAQLASSWAMTEPPQATSRAAPSTPSRPMPVRTTPSAPAPKIAPADASIGSTDGMQPLRAAPVRQAHDGAVVRRLDRQMRIARRDEDPVGRRARMPSSATTASRRGDRAELAREHAS